MRLRTELQRAWRRGLWLLTVVCLGGLADAGENGKELERRVKAAFLYTFAKYVHWPADAFQNTSNTVVIAIVGEDPFGQELDKAIAGKLINGRPVRAERYAQLADVRAAHVVFVPAPGIVAGRFKHALLVGEADGFLKGNGHIQFVVEDGRVRFDVNLRAAKRAGLGLDANLLRVARRVNDKEPAAEGK